MKYRLYQFRIGWSGKHDVGIFACRSTTANENYA